jgi:two-component system, chemotaxis family, sensor kinase Cph1
MHEFQWEQIFQNLIGNAVHYRGEESPRIHIAAKREGSDWVFSVQDNGIGIEPEFKERIFGMLVGFIQQHKFPAQAWGLRSASA